MFPMANRAYASIWTKGFTADTMLEQLEKLLETVPFSAQEAGFTQLVIRALDPAETSLIERDFRRYSVDAARLVGFAREHRHADSAYETRALWDLWTYDASLARWQLQPQPLEIACHGEEYDGGVFADAGHFQIDIGFEHLFTGHARLLSGTAEAPAPQHPAEAAFISLMSQPANLREYHQKTRENIQKLMQWMAPLEQALPVERLHLWSEGEENFEARLDEILAVR